MNDSNIYKFQNKFNCKKRKMLCLVLLTLPQSVFLQTHTLSMQTSFPLALSFPAHWDRRWMFNAEHDWDWAPSVFFTCGPAGRAPPMLLPLPGKRSLRDAQSFTERCWIKNLKRPSKTYDFSMLSLIKGQKVESVMSLPNFRNYLTEK